MTTFKHLVSLSYDFYEDSYEQNLSKLVSGIKKAKEGSIILSPELCLTNFSFDDIQSATEFGLEAIEEILKLSVNKLISFSLTTKRDENYYNTAVICYNGKIVYQRDKYKLFKFGDEHKHFSEGSLEDVKIIEIEGVRFAILICFEIRFTKLWEKIKGADVILVPALWGVLRKKQLEIISNSLAVINQAYVIVSNSKNSDMASSSAIISPFGEQIRDDSKDFLQMDFKKSEIKKMRRYMDVGIS